MLTSGQEITFVCTPSQVNETRFLQVVRKIFSGEQDEKDVDLSAAPPMLRTQLEDRTIHGSSKQPGQEAVVDGGSSDAAGESAPDETESRIPVSNLTCMLAWGRNT